MPLSIAHLGPPGTYAEEAALAYASLLSQKNPQAVLLCPYPSIALTLRAAAEGQADVAVVPVENLIEGSVAVTLDTLWQLDSLRIQRAMVLPIAHALISRAVSLETIQAIYSHPQALGQCQKWLEQFLHQAQLIPTNSTTEALQYLESDPTIGAIASQRAAQLYDLPVLVSPIQDYSDNCTRFWVLGRNGSPTYLDQATGTTYISLAFSVPANTPGALVKPLQVFASRSINLSRVESRPSKRSLGDYVFFMDLEADLKQPSAQSALAELVTCTQVLKVFGSYTVVEAS